jgi:hypothetical protein
VTRRCALALIAAVVATVITACSSSGPPTDPAHNGASPSPTFTNRQLTVRETRRLVVLAELPPMRSPLFTAPDSLRRPLVGPSGRSLVDTTRFWRVRMGIVNARRWIADHPPMGLRASGTSRRVQSGAPTAYGYQYADEDSGAWTRATLQLAVVPAGPGVTFWRLDAVALWLDNAPVRVPAGGPRLTLTPESGCPATDGRAVSVAPSDLDDALLPSGRPTEGLVCRYSGIGELTSHTPLSSSVAAQLAVLAAQVRFAHVDNQVIRCPLDNGSRVAVAFGYPDGESGALWYRSSGCPAVDNGTVFAGVGSGTDALLAALAKLR